MIFYSALWIPKMVLSLVGQWKTEPPWYSLISTVRYIIKKMNGLDKICFKMNFTEISLFFFLLFSLSSRVLEYWVYLHRLMYSFSGVRWGGSIYKLWLIPELILEILFLLLIFPKLRETGPCCVCVEDSIFLQNSRPLDEKIGTWFLPQ